MRGTTTTIQSTPFGVATRVVGGDDIFNVAGDVADVVTTQGLDGQGAINHEAVSIGDLGYDGLIVPGINWASRDLPGGTNGDGFSGNVIIAESDGASLVRETVWRGLGEQSRFLYRAFGDGGGGGHQGLRHRERRTLAPGRSRTTPTTATRACSRPIPPASRAACGTVAQTVRNRAVVLTFDSTNWSQVQTVYVAARQRHRGRGAAHGRGEPQRVAVLTDATVQAQREHGRRLQTGSGPKRPVTVIDKDTAGILLTELARTRTTTGRSKLEGATQESPIGTRSNDQGPGPSRRSRSS